MLLLFLLLLLLLSEMHRISDKGGWAELPLRLRKKNRDREKEQEEEQQQQGGELLFLTEQCEEIER